MEALGVNLQIILTLFLWILGVYGYGLLWDRFLPKTLFQTPLCVAIIGLLGIISLSIALGIVNFAIPLSSGVSILVLLAGLTAFLMKFKAHRQELGFSSSFVYGFILAFGVVAWMACTGDRAYDTGLYHIQATKWVQESPIIFGIANIHTRFGFNNILYNLAAITEVSNLFPHIRSFISNEIITFLALFASFSAIFRMQFHSLHLCFVALGFIWIKVSAFYLLGLYAEGVMGIFGYIIIGFILFIFEQTKQDSQNNQDKLFLIALILAFFSVYIKISGICLILSVIVAFVCIYGLSWKNLKKLALMCSIAVLCGIPWALKGICLSGAVAYPAGIFYFEFLPWAVNNATRASEVLTIHNWAKVGGAQNAQELLASGEWVGYWLNRFVLTSGNKHTLYLAALSLLSLCVFLCFKSSRQVLKQYAWILYTLVLGIAFWFFSAPDPRFGLQYFAPFFGFFISLAFYQILNHRIYTHFTKRTNIPLFSFALTLIVMITFHITSYKRLVSEGIQDTKKIPTYPLQKLTSAYGVEFYAPADEGEDRVYDAPLPAVAYPNTRLAKSSFLGRDMYFISTDSKTPESTQNQQEHK